MKTVKATCECKGFSETDLIIAVRKKPAEDWGWFTLIFVIFLALITGGGALPFIGGWFMYSYFINPSYRCQFCKTEIEEAQFRY
jgi:hypothetical protein